MAAPAGICTFTPFALTDAYRVEEWAEHWPVCRGGGRCLLEAVAGLQSAACKSQLARAWSTTEKIEGLTAFPARRRALDEASFHRLISSIRNEENKGPGGLSGEDQRLNGISDTYKVEAICYLMPFVTAPTASGGVALIRQVRSDKCRADVFGIVLRAVKSWSAAQCIALLWMLPASYSGNTFVEAVAYLDVHARPTDWCAEHSTRLLALVGGDHYRRKIGRYMRVWEGSREVSRATSDGKVLTDGRSALHPLPEKGAGETSCGALATSLSAPLTSDAGEDTEAVGFPESTATNALSGSSRHQTGEVAAPPPPTTDILPATQPAIIPHQTTVIATPMTLPAAVFPPPAAPTAALASAHALCCVCLSREVVHVLLPCFHLCLCASCPYGEACPLCRAVVKGRHQVYRS